MTVCQKIYFFVPLSFCVGVDAFSLASQRYRPLLACFFELLFFLILPKLALPGLPVNDQDISYRHVKTCNVSERWQNAICSR